MHMFDLTATGQTAELFVFIFRKIIFCDFILINDPDSSSLVCKATSVAVQLSCIEVVLTQHHRGCINGIARLRSACVGLTQL